MTHEQELIIVGYAAPDPVVQNPQKTCIPTVDEQVASITAKAEAITERDGAEWAGCRVESTEDIYSDWAARPELDALVKEIQPGDHVILWDMSRLTWSFPMMVEAAGYLIRKGACLHILDFGGENLDLTERTGPHYLQLLEAVVEMSKIDHTWRCANARRAREAGDAAYGCAPPHGKRRRRLRGGGYVDIWCEKQCALIREIKQRRDAGESFKSIAEDFAGRKLKRGSGALWARKRRKRRKLIVDTSKVAEAFHWYTALLERGEDLGA